MVEEGPPLPRLLAIVSPLTAAGAEDMQALLELMHEETDRDE
jgi:hypothetical protein